MKKIVAIAAIAVFTMAAQAETYQYIDIGANQSTLQEKTGQGFDIGWGATKVWDSGVLAGFGMNYGQADIEGETFNNFGGDIKLGYKYKDLAVYGLGSGIYQSYYTEDSAGFGYGGGLEYTPFKHFGIGAEYKTYNMTSETVEYDFETARVYLKIIF